MKVVITGATGSIGLALVRLIIRNDDEVLVITRKESKRNYKIPDDPRVKIVYASLSEFSELNVDALKDYDVFYHLTWDGASGKGRNDMYLQSDNIRYSLDAVKLAQKLGCHTFVGAGSQAEYGPCNEKLTSETPTFPVIGYGFAKLCAGQMTRVLAEQLGLKHIWTRILSVYGPNDGENTMISGLIRDLKNGVTPKLTEGTQLWDYIYCDDAADALYQLGVKGIDKKTYVIGSGIARPLKEYAEIIREAVAPEMSIDYGAVPFSENQIGYLCADITELKNDTGWEPKMNFKTGVKLLLEQ